MFDRFRRGEETADGSTTGDRTTTAERGDVEDEGRFTRDDERGLRRDAAAGDAGPGAVSGAGATTVQEPVRERRPLGDVDRDRDARRREAEAPLVARDTMAAVRARQREQFGGIKWGSAFFGFLSAVGLAAILTAILAAAGVTLGLADQATGADATTSDAQTIGLGGGVALLIALAVAWCCGGYVAGRMARFDGARQGVGVWVWTLAATILIAAAAGVGGSKYDIFQSLNLPSLPVNGSTLTAAGAIAGAAAILVTLLFAVAGGRAGERYHRRVDRLAHTEVPA